MRTEAAVAQARSQRFAAARQPLGQVEAGATMLYRARQQHSALVQGREVALAGSPTKPVRRSALPANTPLNTPWQAVGPLQVQTAAYGLVTGRVSSVAVDPADPSGNTVYVGTTGGGVWKSTNAANAAASVRFTPLTDALQAFSGNAGSSATASISIGAVSVQPGGTGVLLAGTGDPNDATDSYYGTGLLRSTDNGLSWTLVQNSNDGVAGFHSFVGEGFAGFAWSSTANGLVVAAVSSSAEGTQVGAGTPGARVRGLYYSTDAGASWKMATIQDGGQVVQSPSTSFRSFEGNAATSVVWNPLRQRFYAAVRFHGYYESVDGQTWNRLPAQPGNGLSATACPVQAGSSGRTTCPIFRGALAVQPVSGDMFALTVGSGNTDTGLFEDACVSNGSSCTAPTVLWTTKLDSTPMEDSSGLIEQGDYNLALAALPTAQSTIPGTLLFAAAGDLFRCDPGAQGGCVLRNTTNTGNACNAPAKVAPSQHALAFSAGSTAAVPPLFVGNDGGLWRSTDGVNQQSGLCSADDATHFDNLNGGLGSLAEVNGLSTDPTDGGIALVGLGALGSAASTASSANAAFQSVWAQMGTGESSTVLIDQADPRNWLLQSGYGVSLKLCANGANCTAADFAGPPTIGPAQVNGDAELQDAPAILDPALNSNVIVGTCRIYRGPTTGGGTWTTANEISTVLSGPVSGVCSSNNGLVRSLAAGGAQVLTGAAQTSGSPVIYAGMAGVADGGSVAAGGHIFRNLQSNLASGATTWTDVSSGTVANDASHNGMFNPPGFDVSSVAVDPSDATGKTVYATISGFNSPLVYRSVDGANTWFSITANLPNAPANAVLVDPNNASVVYVATDTGVYVTSDVTSCVTVNAQCWSVYGAGLPLAPAVKLTASAAFAVPGSSNNGVLRVGTYGRGIWQIPLITAGQAALPVATLSPTSLTFTPVDVGYTSPAQTVTVTNSSSVPLVVSAVTASAGFVSTDTCTGASLSGNASCTIAVSFAPTAAGPVNGTLSVYGNVLGGYVTANLSGTGSGLATVLLTPASLTFPDTPVKVSSAPRTVTVLNTGSTSTTLQTPTASGDYSIANNTCGSTLAAAGTCTFDVVFTPAAAGSRTGTAQLVDSKGTHTVPLSGNGTSGVVSLSLATVSFPDTPVNGTSPVRTVTVSNTGNGPLQVGAIVVAGDFAETDTCSNTTLNSGATCTVSVTFLPTRSGTRSGTLVVNATTSGSVASTTVVALTGNGQASFSIVLTPQQLQFGSVAVNTVSAVQNITVSNTGTNSGGVGAVSVTGDFAVRGNTCGTSLASQAGCTISIVFTPAGPGPRTGTFTIATDAGVQTATLSGAGTLPATDTLSPLALSFSGATVGTAVAAQAVTLTNNGDVALTLIAANIASGDFTAVNGCGPSLAAHSSCNISVTFVPRSVGSQSGTLVVSDILRSQTVALTGSAAAGAGITLLPGTLSFAATGVGIATAPQTATLTNNGTGALTLSGIAITGDFGLTAADGACTTGSTLPQGGSCVLPVTFTPTGSGQRNGMISVTSNGAAQTLLLNGSGIDFSLAASGSTAGTVLSGNSAVFPLLLTPAITGPQPVSFTCTGAPANSTCKVVSTYTDLSATSTVSVTVLTGTNAAMKRAGLRAAEQRSFGSGWKPTLALLLPVLLLPAGSLRGRRRLSSALLLVFLLAVSAGLNGCGSGRRIPEDGGGDGTGESAVVTPAGTYNLTVTATAAGLSRQVGLTLTVTAQ